MTSSPACSAADGLVLVHGRDAVDMADGEMPSTSNAIAIVLAVNWPPQAPAPGEATSSISVSSSSVDRARGAGADGLEHLLDRDPLAAVVAGQ